MMVVHRRCKGVCLLQLQYVFLPLTFPPKFRGCPEEATEAFLPQTRNEGQVVNPPVTYQRTRLTRWTVVDTGLTLLALSWDP